MFKIQVGNPRVFKRLSSLPRLKSVFLFDLRALDRIKEGALFIKAIDHLRLKNGTFKTTSQGRFSEIDKALIRLLKNTRFTVRVHDFAISDGITSFELYQALKENDLQFELHTSDLFSRIVSYRRFPVKRYTDQSGNLIYGSIFNVVGDSRLPNKFWLSKMIGKYVERSFCEDSKAETLLLNPMILTLIRSGLVKFEEVDVFGINADDSVKYDVIRCMNVLNPQYFSRDQLKKAIVGLTSILTPRGLVILGRTDIKTGQNFASIFQMIDGHLDEIQRFNGGSEIRDIVFDSVNQPL
jgi:hypothetical protein